MGNQWTPFRVSLSKRCLARIFFSVFFSSSLSLPLPPFFLYRFPPYSVFFPSGACLLHDAQLSRIVAVKEDSSSSSSFLLLLLLVLRRISELFRWIDEQRCCGRIFVLFSFVLSLTHILSLSHSLSLSLCPSLSLTLPLPFSLWVELPGKAETRMAEFSAVGEAYKGIFWLVARVLKKELLKYMNTYIMERTWGNFGIPEYKENGSIGKIMYKDRSKHKWKH